MITSFRDMTYLKEYVVDCNATIISGMTTNVGDLTPEMAKVLDDSNLEYAVAFGFYDGKYEPALIIPSISVGMAMRLAQDYKQQSFIHDGLMFTMQDGQAFCRKMEGPDLVLAHDDALQEGAPFTEVLLEHGKKARIRYK